MKQDNIKTMTGKNWLNFLVFWQIGEYNGKGWQPISKLLNRYLCWKGRHGFIVPFSIKVVGGECKVSLKCRHCGKEDVFTRELEKLA